jgi:1-deoxyxylulose-5-phosphate synthase
MNYREIGNTGLKVSEICFGPMRWSSKEEGRLSLHRAIDLGINVIHSSYEYQSINQLGECLQELPKSHDLIHIIKVNSPDHGEPYFDKNLFRKRIEDALKNLNTERIDVVQHLQRGLSSELAYHVEGDVRRLAEFNTVLEELWDVFTQMQAEGKVGYLASFPYTTAYAEKAIDSDKFSALAAYYNPIEVEMTKFFPKLKEKNMSLLAIRPLLTGLLTNKRSDRNKLGLKDPMLEKQWDDAYELLNSIKPYVDELDMSMEEFAIKFCLSTPQVATVIMGLNRLEQVETAVSAANGQYFEAGFIDKIINIINQARKERYTWPPY